MVTQTTFTTVALILIVLGVFLIFSGGTAFGGIFDGDAASDKERIDCTIGLRNVFIPFVDTSIKSVDCVKEDVGFCVPSFFPQLTLFAQDVNLQMEVDAQLRDSEDLTISSGTSAEFILSANCVPKKTHNVIIKLFNDDGGEIDRELVII